MPLSPDSIIDRIYLKAQLRKWRLLAVAFAVMGLLIAVGNSSKNSPASPKKDYIARISFDGIIGDDQKIYKLISDVGNDTKAKAVIVWIDSPGGSAVGGEEIYLRLKELSAKKPVVTVMRSVAASAGYMISLGTDYVFAREGTITGSIGVLIETAEVTELAQKLGIKPIAIKSAPLKASPSPFEKSTPEAEKVMHDMIMDFYDRFVKMTEERRKLPHEQALILADGRVFSGRKAVETKLIDAIGGEKEAVDWLVKNRQIATDLEIFDAKVEDKKDLLDRVLEGSIGSFWQKSKTGLDGLVSLWHPKLN